MSEFIKNKKIGIILLVLLAIVILVQNFDLNHNDFNSKQVIVDHRESNSVNDNFNHQPESPKTADSSPNKIQIISKNDTLARKDGLNQTIKFYFNDTKNKQPITNLTTNGIIVKDNQTISGDFKIRTGGIGDHNWTLYNMMGGYYKLNISTKGLNSGWIRLAINACISNNWSIECVDFYLRGNITEIIIMNMLDPGSKLSWGKCFIGSNLTLEFVIVDRDFNNITVTDEEHQASFFITYSKINNTECNGTLSNDFTYTEETRLTIFRGHIVTSPITVLGIYMIIIKANLLNYDFNSFSFALDIKEKYVSNITILQMPTIVVAGEAFSIYVLTRYYNGTGWACLINAKINLTLIINEKIVSRTFFSMTRPTDKDGIVGFDIIIPIKTSTVIFDVNIVSGYYYETTSLKKIEITVISFFDYLMYCLLFIITILGIVAYAVSIYRTNVLPDKRKKEQYLYEFQSCYKDLINLMYVFVIHKETQFSLYFKSCNFKENDIKLIVDLLFRISELKMDTKESGDLSEIFYNNKNILIGDGKFLRVGLFSTERPSATLKKHLREFINNLEQTHVNELSNWRGQLNLFEDVGQIFDSIFNTSIMLPHQISYEFSELSSLKSKYSLEVLEIAKYLSKFPERKYHFIAQLIKEGFYKANSEFIVNIKRKDFFFFSGLIQEVFERYRRKLADVLIGLKELMDKKIFTSIEVPTREIKSISQDELSAFNEKFLDLINLTPEEKQNILNTFNKMNRLERAAYLASISRNNKFNSDSIKTKSD